MSGESSYLGFLMLFECRYSNFPLQKHFNEAWNHLILVTNERRINWKVRCRMTIGSTFSWGSVLGFNTPLWQGVNWPWAAATAKTDLWQSILQNKLIPFFTQYPCFLLSDNCLIWLQRNHKETQLETFSILLLPALTIKEFGNLILTQFYVQWNLC